MRSVFVVSFLAFTAVTAGGYVISWYGQASAAKRALEQGIATINEKQKYITYDAIETSGFPSNIYVSIVKPHFKGRIDQLFKAAPTDTGKELPQWDEDALLDGKITFGISALSDQFTLDVNGNWTENSTVGGQTISSIHQQTGDFTCNLQFQRSMGFFDTLWNFQSLDSDAKTLANNFRMFDCNSAGQKTVDATTKAAFNIAGPMRLYLTSAPLQSNENLRFYLEIANLEVTPLGDAQVASYYHAISPGYDMPLNFSSYGKQNMEIDLSYAGAVDLQATNNPPVDISLAKLNISNQVYNTHTSLHFTNTPSDSSRVSTISFHNDGEFSEQYDTLIHTIANNYIKQLYTTNDPTAQKTKALIQQYSPDQLYSIIYPSIPNFNALGKVLLTLEGSFSGDANSAAGIYTLNQLQASTTPYSINGQGNMRVDKGSLPTGNMTFNCVNCLKMVDDMADYSARFLKTTSYFTPAKANVMTIEPVQVDAIKRFLTILSPSSANAADNTTLSFTLASANQNITINGKSIAEVSALYNEYVRPTLKQAPASQPQ